jgi:hypothetical protein
MSISSRANGGSFNPALILPLQPRVFDSFHKLVTYFIHLLTSFIPLFCVFEILCVFRTFVHSFHTFLSDFTHWLNVRVYPMTGARQAVEDDVFYLFLQKQKSAQSYIPQGYFPPYEPV